MPLGGYATEVRAALAFDAFALTLAGGCVVLLLLPLDLINPDALLLLQQ